MTINIFLGYLNYTMANIKVNFIIINLFCGVGILTSSHFEISLKLTMFIYKITCPEIEDRLFGFLFKYI